MAEDLEKKLQMLEAREKEFQEKQNSFLEEQLRLKRNQLISLGKDSVELVEAINDVEALDKIIAKRNEQIKKEKEDEDEKKKKEKESSVKTMSKANGSIPTFVMPDGKETKLNSKDAIDDSEMKGIYIDPMSAPKFNSHKSFARPALLYDGDGFPRLVG